MEITKRNELHFPETKPFSPETDREAIRHLKELHLANSRVKHPEVPYHTTPKYSAANTNGLTKCIIAFIRLRGGQAERISSQGRMMDDRQTFVDSVGITRTIGSTRWIKASSQVGTADVSATIEGRSVKIEVKLKRTQDRQSEAQKKYQAQIENAGGIYFTATSFFGFLSWYYKTIA